MNRQQSRNERQSSEVDLFVGSVRFLPESTVEDRASSSSYRPNMSPLNELIQELRRKNAMTAAASPGLQNPSILDNSDPWGGIVDDVDASAMNIYPPSSTRASFGSDSIMFTLECTCQGPANTSLNTTSSSRHRRRPCFDVRYAQRRSSFGYASPIRSSNTSSAGGDNTPYTGGENVYCPDCGKLVPKNNNGRVSSGEEQLLAMIHNPTSPRQMRMNSWLDSPRIERVEAPRHAEELLQVTPQLRVISPASTDMNVAELSSSKNILSLFLPTNNNSTKTNHSSSNNQNKQSHAGDSFHSNTVRGTTNLNPPVSDYKASLRRDRDNQQAAGELASLMWMCAHEMSLEDYGIVESETFTSVFALVHSHDDMDRRMAGLAALDALIDAPSADEEKKAIKFANTLSGGLRSAHGNYEFLSAVSKALGHMAKKNVDFVESEVTRALEWLRTERSDRR